MFPALLASSLPTLSTCCRLLMKIVGFRARFYPDPELGHILGLPAAMCTVKPIHATEEAMLLMQA